MRKYFVIIALFCVLAASQAGAETKFSSSIHDFPLMNGLVEVSGNSMDFNKAQGRIAQITLRSEKPSVNEIMVFYTNTLPQLGWEKASQMSWSRGDEMLILDVTQDASGVPWLGVKIFPIR